MCGWWIRSGRPAAAGAEGSIIVRLPLPPGALPTLWQDDKRFVASYLEAFPGHYLTGDGGRLDEDGYLFVMGRTDDVINVAGHRLSTGGMEEVLAAHPDVAECAIIGVADAMKGQVPRGFVVLKSGVHRPESEVSAELIQLVRDRIGAVASLREVAVVPGLPKTRSGKDPAAHHAWHRRRCRRARALHHRERWRAGRAASGPAAGLTLFESVGPIR